MASKVTVLCPNGRRVSVKVSPNTNILKVLEEACSKQGLAPEDYDICYFNKPLDLSLSLRYANLPNNAVLELGPTKRVRQEGTVTVAVQLESGERVTSDFLPSSSLMEILKVCRSSREIVAMNNEVPVFIYMQQKFTGNQIETTTLRGLGLTNGKASIRLMFRPVDSLDEQAHVSAPLSRPVVSPNDNARPKKSSSTDFYSEESAKKQPRLDLDNVQTVQTQFNEQLPSEEPIQPTLVQEEAMDETMCSDTHTDNENVNTSSLETMEVEKEPEKEPIGNIYYLGARNAVLFNLQDILEVKKEDFSDEFFELTVSDVRFLMQELTRTRCEMENMPLLTKCWRERQLLQELQVYRQTVIRIYFPDQLVLQGTFIADETVNSVLDFVKTFLENPDLHIYLYTAPPKVILTPDTKLLEARLVPASVVHFGCDSPCSSYLRSDIKKQISDPRAASHAAAQCRKKYICNESSSHSQPDMDMTEDSSTQRTLSSNMFASSSSGTIPGWLRLGKK